MHLIMLVEDDEDIRCSVTEILKEEGFSVVAAENGEAALGHLRNGVRPCVIILDLMMPVMDGWAFRGKQSSDPALSSIPVVIVSAANDVRRHAASLAVSDYLVKPLDLPLLLNTIERIC